MRESNGWSRWWPFVLLCALGGTRWMASDALPGSASTLATGALGCGSAAALCVLFLQWRRPSPYQFSQFWRCMLGGGLLIAGPMLRLVSPGAVSGAGFAMALALTPVVIAIIDAANGQGGECFAGRLWPGLAAIAGLLLVVQEPSLSRPGADVLLVLTPLLTGVGAAIFCSAQESPWRLPAGLLGACVVLGAASVISAGVSHAAVWPEMRGVAAGLDALEAFLTLLALGRISAARWSAQFAVVPLLVLLEGVAMLRSAVPGRTTVGLLLLAAAGVAMLIAPAEEETRLVLGVPRPEPRHSD